MGSRRDSGNKQSDAGASNGSNGNENGGQSSSSRHRKQGSRVVAPSEQGGRGDLIGRRIAVATGADRTKNRRSRRNSKGSSNSQSGSRGSHSSRNSSGNSSATDMAGKSSGSESNKKKKRMSRKQRAAFKESQLLLGDNRQLNGSIYMALSKNFGKEKAVSESDEDQVLSNDVILIDSDEETSDRADTTTKKDSPAPTEQPTTEEEPKDKEEENAETNALTSNQDFIAFDFSDDEEPEEEGLDDEAEQDKIAKERDDYSPSYNDPTEADSRKRKRDLSDDEDDGKTSHTRHTAVPKKRQDVSLEFPWINRGDHSQEPEVADWLTKEIKDFVAYVSPSEAEIHARNDAVARIQKVVTGLWSDAEVRVFGSYATDMYLPGSDIDMVILSKSGKYDSRAYLYQLASRMKSSGIATSVEVIAKARVPIIKFVEIGSGIHIDISFERTNGVEAVETIRTWAQEFKCLRYLVMVVKQFLARRKMNNVHTGGLGGYSVICTVVNFLKMHPKLASGVMDAERNLGVLMIEYFELYGKHFNYDNVALKMKGEMGYLPKRKYPDMQPTVARNTFALAIQDPADSSNNISRGSFNIRGIKKAFGGAYDMLTARCYEVEFMSMKKRRGLSILGNIIRVKGPERDFIDSTGLVHNVAYGDSPSASPQLPPPPPPQRQPPPPAASTAPKRKTQQGASSSVEYMSLSSEDEEEEEDNRTAKKVKGIKASPLNQKESRSNPASSNGQKAEDFIVIDSDSSSDESAAKGLATTTPITKTISNDSATQDSRTSSVPQSKKRDYWAEKSGIISI